MPKQRAQGWRPIAGGFYVRLIEQWPTSRASVALYIALGFMQTFARVPNRTVVIAGHPNSGWSSADEGTPGSFELEFAFEITDDGNRNFLLVYSSVDGRYAADTWHETLEGAYAAAAEEFGIDESEWMK